jgi:hypothetical protein
MMLCDACENARFPLIAAAKRSRTGKPKKDHTATTMTTDPTSLPFSESHSDGNAVAAPLVLTNTSEKSSAADYQAIIVNELLLYVVHYRNRSTVDALRRVVLTFYSSSDVHEAKEGIAGPYRLKYGDSPFLTDRRDSTTRSTQEAELDDIFGLLDYIDGQGSLQELHIVASDLNRLPRYDPEELNPGSLIERQQKLDISIGKLSTEIESLSEALNAGSSTRATSNQQTFDSAITDMQKRIDTLQSSVTSRIDQLSSMCTQSGTSLSGISNHAAPLHDLDRSRNIILFGIAENREISVWRHQIDDVLKFTVDRDVAVSDAIRLGKFRSDKIRPVLVKLHSAWDRRIILRSSWKLKSFPERIYISPDEPLDVRRKHTLERIKTRAERDGKSVDVQNDVLFVDNTAVYSLEEGLIQNRNG